MGGGGHVNWFVLRSGRKIVGVYVGKRAGWYNGGWFLEGEHR